MTELKIDEGDKLWFAWPLPGLTVNLDYDWRVIGPYEPEDFPEDDEAKTLDLIRQNGFHRMLYYRVDAPTKDKALADAVAEHKAFVKRNRVRADAAYEAAKADKS